MFYHSNPQNKFKFEMNIISEKVHYDFVNKIH